MSRIASILVSLLLLCGAAWGAPPCPGGTNVGPPNIATCYSYTMLNFTGTDNGLNYRGRFSPATFDRNSAQTFLDHEGLLHRITSNDDPAFTGARRARNLLAADTSEDFSGASWSKLGTATVTGTNTINLPAEGDRILQNTLSGIPDFGKTATFSVTLSGSGTVSIHISRISGTDESTTKEITLTSTPTRYAVSHTFALANNTGIYGRIVRAVGQTATTVTANYAMLEETTGQTVTAPSEYVSTHQYCDGLGVKGIRYFSYANGNTVDGNGVVTEAQGAALTGMKGFAKGNAVTNKIAGAYNALGPDMLSTTNIYAGYDFTSGWTATNATINDSNTFTTTAINGYIRRAASATIGKRYRLTVNGTISAGNFLVADASTGLSLLVGFGTVDFTAQSESGVVLRAALSGAVVDITTLTMYEIGAANSAGTFYSGAGASAAATRIAVATWYNPLPGITCSGGTDGESSVTIVSDTAKLASATPILTRLIPSGKVYKAVAGASASMDITLTGNLSAATHTVSLYARGESAADDAIALGDAVGGMGAAQALTDSYQLISRTYTAGASGTKYTIAAGDTVYFCLMQSAALTVPTYPVLVEGAAASVVEAALTIPVADGVNLSKAAGTVTVEFTAGFDSSSFPSGVGIVIFSSVDGNSQLTMSYSIASGLRIWVYDGTSSTIRVIPAFSKGDTITFKSTWSKSRNKLNVYASTAGWGTAVAYDGAFPLSSYWYIGYASAYPFSIKNITVTNTFDKAGL